MTEQIPVREESEPGVKQVIVIRRDLGMRRGKEIAQGSHASGAWLAERIRSGNNYADGGRVHQIPPPEGPDGYHVESLIELTVAEFEWLTGAFTKVVCQVPDLPALEAVAAAARAAGVRVHVITDAGRTEFGGVPTVTALAVGPDWSVAVDAVTGGLKLY